MAAQAQSSLANKSEYNDFATPNVANVSDLLLSSAPGVTEWDNFNQIRLESASILSFSHTMKVNQMNLVLEATANKTMKNRKIKP